MSSHTTGSTSSHHAATPCAEPISTETLERCAELLAADEIDWPEGLSDEQEADLLAAVRCHRRARLVKFIASRIAADLASAARDRATEAHP